MTGQLDFDWEHEPSFARHASRRVMLAFFDWLGEHGVAKRSIPMPDHTSRQWLVFLYQKVDRPALEAWEPPEFEEE